MVKAYKKCKDRYSTQGLAIIGPITPEKPYITTISSPESVVIALVKRQCVLTNPTDYKTWRSLREFFDEEFSVLYPNFSSNLEPLPFYKWLQTSNMSPGNKKMCKAFYEEHGHEEYTDAECKQLASIQVFPKRDKYSNTGFFEKSSSFFNRSISPFAPVVNNKTGPPIAAFQNYLHEEWDDWVFFAAGKNSDQLSDWYANVPVGWRAFEDDFTFYDSSIGVPAQKYLIYLYKKSGLPTFCPSFLGMKKAQSYESKGCSRNGVKFRVEGTMKSGASDTCLGNSLLNVSAHLYSLAKINNCSLAFLKTRVRMAVLGDDNLFFLHPDLTCVGLEEELIKLGFQPKLKECKNHSEAIFLNMRLYPSESGLKFGPLPGRLISRLGYTVTIPKDSETRMAEIATAFRDSCANIPVLREYFDKIWFLTSRKNLGKNKHRTNNAEEVQRRDFPYMMFAKSSRQPSGLSDQHFCELYNLSLEELNSLRRYLQEVKTLTTTLAHPVLTKILDKDLG